MGDERENHARNHNCHYNSLPVTNGGVFVIVAGTVDLSFLEILIVGSPTTKRDLQALVVPQTHGLARTSRTLHFYHVERSISSVQFWLKKLFLEILSSTLLTQHTFNVRCIFQYRIGQISPSSTKPKINQNFLIVNTSFHYLLWSRIQITLFSDNKKLFSNPKPI